MALTASDIKLYESTNGRGGAITGNPVSAALNGLFPEVSSGDSFAGQNFYRCIYVKNEGAQTLLNAGVKITEDTTSINTYIRVGAGINSYPVAESSIANDVTPPPSVNWEATIGSVVNLGDIPSNQWKAIWLHRNVTAGAVAVNADTATIQIFGDTLE